MDSYNPIISTLAYADIFDYPLTEEEIWEWMITGERGEGLGDRKEFAHSLQFALHSHSIRMSQGFYFLKGWEGIVKIRQQRERWSKLKLQRAEKVAGILRLIPWAKLIGITGGLARNNASKEDDIDLFFITTNNRLWLTRGLVVLILMIFGMYRRQNKVTDMICPNMFVSEGNLEMRPHDLYMAHEVCLMRPIFVKENSYQSFLHENRWVEMFLPNMFKIKNQRSKIKDQKSKLFSFLILICNFTFYILNFTLVEKISRFLQLWYMRSRRTTETVSDNLIKFHPHDVREEILGKWKEKVAVYRQKLND